MKKNYFSPMAKVVTINGQSFMDDAVSGAVFATECGAEARPFL